jgi:DNA replication protein DnaC
MTAPRVKLDIDATREKLAALGLGHAVDALEGLLAEAVRNEMPAHVFLDRLLDAERSGREERRIRTMLKTAKIPTGATLESEPLSAIGPRTMASDFAFQPAIERSRIETLATGGWIRNAEVVLMQGPPGVGKSHLLCGLGIRAIQLGFSVQYFRFDELLTALRADAHLPPARLKSRKYMSSALLLVDEMGYDPMSREEASLFFRLVSYRYGRGAFAIGLERMATRWLTHHHQQEYPRLDRTAGRRRGAGHRHPRPVAASRPCPQHQGPQLPTARPRGGPQGLTHATTPSRPRLRRARSDS